jgi:hypothetical protein
VIIIKFLKIDSEINLGQGPGHGSRGSTQVDSGQCKDKRYYNHSFKTKLMGQLWQGSGHRLRGSTCVDPSQCINKNSYNHCFKTRLRS